MIRTGDELLVSTPVITASSRSKPFSFLPSAGIASRMASDWGMGPDADKPFQMLLAGKDQRQEGSLNLLEQAYKLAMDVITSNRKAWTDIWKMLLEKEAITGEEAASCLLG